MRVHRGQGDEGKVKRKMRERLEKARSIMKRGEGRERLERAKDE